ncbi:MAG: membrane dipeptidase [Phenylobacterium sp.]|nr:membrane dipeptidase [Phenylobacterium sp.]MDP3175705.1 membrane dipeptidase [Phenylobacterium sp.]
MNRNSMTRRMLLAGAAALTLAAGQAWAQAAPDVDAIHRRALVLDSHVDIALPNISPRYLAADGKSKSDLAKLRAGGVDAIVYAVTSNTGARTREGYAAGAAEAAERLAAILAVARDHPDQAQIAYSAADVRRIVDTGRVAIILGFLNAYSLGEDVNGLDDLYAKGVRVVGLAHAGNTAFADSSRPQAGAGEEHGGLSALGRAAVTRMNDLGELIDVSQLSHQAVLQTVAQSRTPVVASHAAVLTLADTLRGMNDAEIDAIGAKGGVIQITAFNRYLRPKPADYDARLLALRKTYGLPESGTSYQGSDDLPEPKRSGFYRDFYALEEQAGVKGLVDHIEYVAKRIGVDHVGVGTDFNRGRCRRLPGRESGRKRHARTAGAGPY